MRVGVVVQLAVTVCLSLQVACRTATPGDAVKTSSVEASLLTGGLSGLYYPGYLRSFSRSDNVCRKGEPSGVCWVEVDRNAGDERRQYGLLVGYRDLRSLQSKSELLLNLESGDLHDGTRVYLSPTKGGSFYLYREKLQEMMEILGVSSTIFPFEYLAGVVSQLDRMQDIDAVTAELYHEDLLRGQQNNVIITYKAKEDRQILLQCFSGKKLVTEKSIKVEKGAARLIESIDIPRQLSEAASTYIQISLVSLGSGPFKVFDAKKIARRLID